MTLDDTISETKKDGNPEWSKRRVGAPQVIRRNEVREGGFIVVERTRKKRLLRPAAWPVEHDSLEVAYAAVKRLRAQNPEREFCVFQQIGSLAPEEGGCGDASRD